MARVMIDEVQLARVLVFIRLYKEAKQLEELMGPMWALTLVELAHADKRQELLKLLG